jgi:Zn-dependent protease with chaperone function
MIRAGLVLALLVWVGLLAAPLAAQQRTPQANPHGQGYKLPPGKYQRAVAYSHWQYAMHFLGVLWTVGTLVVILNLRVAPRLSNWAQHISGRRLLQAALFVPGLMLVLNLPHLPLEMFGHWLDRRYDQSIQGWISWLWDWTKGELLGFGIAIVLAWILYGAIRRSPRRWWLHFWLASLPLLVFLLFIQPLVIEPMFFEFKPLGETQPALVDALLKVVGRGGLTIPADRMYEMKASEKLNSLNAYVSGIGSSKRVVVWDTTIAKMTAPQIQFVFGHEMGHYVLNHVPKEIAIFAVLLLLALLATYHGMNWALERWGPRLEIRGVEDWASLPLLILICTLAVFVAEPIANTVSRYFEHQADIYAIEVTFGLIPPAAQTGAETFQVLGETGLAEPDPNPLIKFWLYDHPSISERVRFAQQYDPWSRNETKYGR